MFTRQIRNPFFFQLNGVNILNSSKFHCFDHLNLNQPLPQSLRNKTAASLRSGALTHVCSRSFPTCVNFLRSSAHTHNFNHPIRVRCRVRRGTPCLHNFCKEHTTASSGLAWPMAKYNRPPHYLPIDERRAIEAHQYRRRAIGIVEFSSWRLDGCNGSK